MRKKMAIGGSLIVAAILGFAIWSGEGDETGWQFVVEVEARTLGGGVLASQQVVADSCTPDEYGTCLIKWDWESASLPTGVHEWVRPYFVSDGYEIPVAFVPAWCNVDLELCQAGLTCYEDGTAVVAEPSAECLAQLDEVCNLWPDDQGFWYAGTLDDSPGQFAFVEPMELLVEWYDICPVPEPTPTIGTPPPTYTPEPTYTPKPTPTCRPTWTPFTATPLSTSTPQPISTDYPSQPSW